jgi:LemA protein
MSWVVGVCGLLIIAYAIWLFNRLVADRNLVRQAFSDIDVQLKRRADLVPPLVATVQAYASHEKALLEAATRLRGESARVAAHSAARFKMENGLATALQRLLVLQESYPSLKSDANFRDLSAKLVDVEDHLQYARRFYNGAVKQYVTRLQTFPDLILARALAFKTVPFFEADDRSAVKVSL